MRTLIALILCLMLLTVPAAAEEDMTIVIASDMHFLSPSLTDYGEAFMALLQAADAKMTHRTPEIMQTFVAEMLALSPDAVVLTGDLTLNGAPASHYDLDDLLHPLKDAGIRVLALSGNHDSGSAAYSFSEEGAKMVLGLGDVQFAGRYREYGYNDAIARDEHSASYVAALSDTLWFLLLDTNCNEVEGWLLPSTLEWAEQQLQAAQAAGATVIGATHQNLFLHSALFDGGYQIYNAQPLINLYKQYGVRLHFSGHMHIQHILQQDGIAEVASSSLAVAPHQYGVLTVSPSGAMQYRTRELDVSAWAREQGLTDPELLDFAAASQDFFDQKTLSSATRRTADLPIPDDARQRMIDLAVTINRAYFAGCVPADYDAEAFVLWQTYSNDEFYLPYLQSMLDDAGRDMRILTLP